MQFPNIALAFITGCGLGLWGCALPVERENVEARSEPYASEWEVPYLHQRDLDGIGESACAPTSLAMLLNFYYPSADVDPREVYGNGLQGYGYHGPAVGYRNVSFAEGWTADPGLSVVPRDFRRHYRGHYSGARGIEAIRAFLRDKWAVDSRVLTSASAVYEAVARGPLLGHVWAHGNRAWGHYLVIVGVDDGSGDVTLHDPYAPWRRGDEPGDGLRIARDEFFGRWFRDALELVPRLSAEQRAETVVASSAGQSFALDDIDARTGRRGSENYVWRRYYGAGGARGDAGSWVYPTERGHRATFTPRIGTTKLFDIDAVVVADPHSGRATYVLRSATGTEVARTTVDLRAAPSSYRTVPLARAVRIGPGAVIEVRDIDPGTNIDTIRLTPTAGDASCEDECTTGERRCRDEWTREACGGSDDGCNRWGSPQTCAAGCSGGSCRPPPTCTDECTAGDRRCLDAWTREACGESDDGCNRWGSPQTCAAGCSAGSCSSPPRCGDGTCDAASGESCSTCPGDCAGPEVADFVDNDCDGAVDEMHRMRLFRRYYSNGRGCGGSLADWDHCVSTGRSGAPCVGTGQGGGAAYVEDGTSLTIYDLAVGGGATEVVVGPHRLTLLGSCYHAATTWHIYEPTSSPEYGRPGWSCVPIGYVRTGTAIPGAIAVYRHQEDAMTSRMYDMSPTSGDGLAACSWSHGRAWWAWD